jgi:hypothetical protein
MGVIVAVMLGISGGAARTHRPEEAGMLSYGV